jgi:hypothetical protein
VFDGLRAAGVNASLAGDLDASVKQVIDSVLATWVEEEPAGLRPEHGLAADIKGDDARELRPPQQQRGIPY